MLLLIIRVHHVEVRLKDDIEGPLHLLEASALLLVSSLAAKKLISQHSSVLTLPLLLPDWVGDAGHLLRLLARLGCTARDHIDRPSLDGGLGGLVGCLDSLDGLAIVAIERSIPALLLVHRRVASC